MNEKLINIQSELKAPKGQKNTFGNYNYRSCEDILEAVKPLLKKEGLSLTLSDEVENIGAHNYIKTTATLTEGENRMWVSAFAREAETKKGMDDAQITGAASSYARKYALNGLFAIDDTKDADSQDYTAQSAKPASRTTQAALATAIQKQQLKNTMSALGMNQEAMVDSIKQALGKDKVETVADYHEVIEYLEAL